MNVAIPPVEELSNLELTDLLDLLAKCTEYYCHLIKNEGFSEESDSFKKIVQSVQVAIDVKNEFARTTKLL